MTSAPLPFLLDIRQAAENIERFQIGFGSPAFKADELTHSAVEGRLQNSCGALSQLCRIDAASAAAFSLQRDLNGLRNIPGLGYSGANEGELWDASRPHPPKLLAAARALSPRPPTGTAA